MQTPVRWGRTALRRFALLAAVAAAVSGGGLTAAGPAAAASCPPVPISGTPGQRVKTAGDPTVYLIDGLGKKRAIPSESVYFQLFDSWDGVRVNDYAACYPTGVTLTGAYLFKSGSSSAVYLLDGGYRRWIPSESAFDKYGFSWGKIRTVSQSTVNSYPLGADWS